MPAGTLENTSGAELIIEGLGWVLPTAHTETVDHESESPYTWTRAAAELSSLITATDIVIRDQNAVIVPSTLVLRWINELTLVDTPLSLPLYTFVGGFRNRVPNNGLRWLDHNQNLNHTEAGFVIAAPAIIRSMILVTKQTEASNTYDLRIYSDPTGSPSLVVSSVLTTTTGNREFSVNNLNIALAADEYGMRLERVSGSGRSDFNNGIAHIVCEIR